MAVVVATVVVVAIVVVVIVVTVVVVSMRRGGRDRRRLRLVGPIVRLARATVGCIALQHHWFLPINCHFRRL